MPGQRKGFLQAGEQVTRWWWLWLVAGALWIIASLIITQFQSVSLVTVGVIIGILFLVAGVQELFLAASRQRWRWLGIAFGVIFLAAGIYALVNPIHTFVVVADLAGFLFLLVGIFWTIEAFAARGVDDLWFLGLLSGIILIVLGFWTGGWSSPPGPPPCSSLSRSGRCAMASSISSRRSTSDGRVSHTTQRP